MTGARITAEIRERVRKAAGNRCGYCQSPASLVFAQMEIEHIIPQAKGGTDSEDNLWLACRLCNSFKATKTQGIDPVSGVVVPLYNPRKQRWNGHFAWSPDGALIAGRTQSGRATVLALRLNNPIAVAVRKAWIEAGWHPPRI